jgi:putative transposase
MATRSAYPTDLTDAQWACLVDLVPDQRPLGRPVKYARREVLNALLYITHTGCQGRALPHDVPPWPVVRYYFDRWTADRTLERLHTALRERVRSKAGRDPQPSAGMLDSQSVKVGHQPGVRGYDGGKHVTGRKRHLLVDTLGLVLLVVVTAANISDSAGAHLLLDPHVAQFSRLRRVWADSSYQGGVETWVRTAWKWVLEIVRHIVPVHKFVLLPKRWVVERTFGWWGHARRLSKDYEVQPINSASWIYLTMIHLMLCRLAPPPNQRKKKSPTQLS